MDQRDRCPNSASQADLHARPQIVRSRFDRRVQTLRYAQHIGRPKALDKSKAALALRMHASGESASTIAATLSVSRATVYRVLGEQNEVA